MKVYVVYREGYNADFNESFVNFKIFADEAKANAYRETRKTKDGFYWDKMEEKEVE